MKISLRALRVNAELTQEDAAKAIGVTKRTLQSWEANATYPNISTLVKLCKVYGCGLEDIFLPVDSAISEN